MEAKMKLKDLTNKDIDTNFVIISEVEKAIKDKNNERLKKYSFRGVANQKTYAQHGSFGPSKAYVKEIDPETEVLLVE